MSEVSISLSGILATACKAARSSSVSFLGIAIFIYLPLLPGCLPGADDSARDVVATVGPCVDDEQKDTAGFAYRVPSVAVRMGIVPGQRQRVGKSDFADRKRQPMFAA